ncbi:MAG: formate dehydrogenase accessory sulfurtransferase FdhD [Candidatus Lokiarchaeota archaeon]|nr:formate dehydrogenase accessory sulfurtransferase FdhD [Candidatus Lokiarchaeota archaeon]
MFKRKVSIIQIKKDKKKEIFDQVLVEKSINILINSQPLVNIICLPKDIKQLAIGFLYSIGVIDNIRDIKTIKIDESKVNIQLKSSRTLKNISNYLKKNPISRIIDTSCGISSSWRDIIKQKLNNDKEKNTSSDKDIQINQENIFLALKEMQINTTLFRETGGCHGASIFNIEDKKMLIIMEDIGRHNAIDKAIGELIINNIPLNNVLLTTTGRLTGDVVLKAIRAKIPIVASISAPIESGIRLAFAYGITLIGFVRGSRMNIYTHPKRIIL